MELKQDFLEAWGEAIFFLIGIIILAYITLNTFLKVKIETVDGNVKNYILAIDNKNYTAAEVKEYCRNMSEYIDGDKFLFINIDPNITSVDEVAKGTFKVNYRVGDDESTEYIHQKANNSDNE